jgi:alpha-L-fucosidase
MRSKLRTICFVLGATSLFFFTSGILFAQDSSSADRDQRMQWWREARFGMFVHWGVYAVPAGEYEGQQYERIGEWIMNSAKIPRTDYEKFATEFNPQKFDADFWIQTAKNAGMKYFVITSKHHDGFCLFDATNSEYDIVDATPYGKDTLKALSQACRRHGVKFCTYYSIMDWHHPTQLPAKVEDGRPTWNPTRIEEGQKEAYTEYMKAHLHILITEYETQVLWFDGEWPKWWTNEDGQALYNWLRELNPNLIVNNRVGAGRNGMSGFSKEGSFAGDFGTPEQEIPHESVGLAWESCMTMNDTWGFKRDDHNWKSTKVLIRNLIDIVSKGGNYLLNIGPMADGSIPPASVERLQGIGKWMSANGESIYGTSAGPIDQPAWGRVTQKSEEGTLYLHVFDWPGDGKLSVEGLSGQVSRATLLDGGRKVPVVYEGNALVLSLPAVAPDPIASVIRLQMRELGLP